MYLQTLNFSSSASHDEHWRICHQVQNYLIIDDTLYFRGVDYFLHHCLTHVEVELVLNEFHSGACGVHLSRLETTQNILGVILARTLM